MERDLWKYAGILSGGAILGYSLNATLVVTLITAIALLAWQLHRINLILNWLEKPAKYPVPEFGGMFYLLHKKLTQRNKQYAKRKKQLTGYLTQFRKAVGAMPDAIILIDDWGRIEWANNNSIALLGIHWPEDVGVRFSHLIRHPEVADILESADSLIETKEISSISHNDKEINLKSVPYSDSTRMIIARDVSSLISVNQMHTDFVANVSHELKTPLTVFKGYVEILQSSNDLPDKFSKPLEQMDAQCTRMQLIVNDLLYLAKLENKADQAQHQEVNVSHLVKNILVAVQPLLNEKQHNISLKIDDSLNLLGAPTELHSAFSNLIVNAISYTEEEGDIELRWLSTGTGATFSVKDNGLGIPSQHLSRLTQRFYRIDNDRSRESGGTGLGLAIVKHVLQRHDAELEIQSEEGEGSVFSCHFNQHQVLSK